MRLVLPQLRVPGCHRTAPWALLLAASLASGPLLAAQTTVAKPAAAPAESTESATQGAIAGLEPAMNKISAVMPELKVSKWKASKGLREATSSDVESIQQDLGTTLPGLIEKAAASKNQLAPSFAVYRNVDALYDVLLRVAYLANFAGSRDEARSLETVRGALEAARARLSKALLSAAAAQDAELVHIRKLAAEKPPPPPKTIIVNDGPVRKHTSHRKTSR